MSEKLPTIHSNEDNLNLNTESNALSIDRENFADIVKMYSLPGAPLVNWEQYEKLARSHEAILKRLPKDIETALGSNLLRVQAEAVELIEVVSDGVYREKLQGIALDVTRNNISKFSALEDEDEDVDDYWNIPSNMAISPIQQVVSMIQCLPQPEQEPLINLVLSSSNKNLRSLGESVFNYDNGYKGIIQKNKIEQLSEVDRAIRLRELLSCSVSPVMLSYAKMIDDLPKEEQGVLRNILLNSVRSGVSEAKGGELTWPVDLIKYVPEANRLELINELLNGNFNYRKRGQIFRVVESLSPEDRKKFNEMLLVGNGDIFKELAVKTPLYDESPETFRSAVFHKDGSETTLLDTVPGHESLKGKVIIRTMSERSYITWMKAFSAYDLWKKWGFDYVPVEPIVRAKVGEKPLTIDVAAQVLGPSIQAWVDADGPFPGEIYEQKEKILNALRELGISHGHTHDGNFCLYFYKNTKGDVDLSRPPRVYCIDFDHSDFGL